MIRAALHILAAALLTLLSQIGGLAYLLAIAALRGWKRRLLAFAALYAGLSVAAVFVAPVFGREALPCFERDGLAARTPLTCALNRHYVTPELALLARSLAQDMDEDYPGTVTLYLDANFPFVTGFPLVPHLSHDDGRKIDLAFFYETDGAYIAGVTPSPVGYWGFLDPHGDDPETCRSGAWYSLRWNMAWLQPFLRRDLTVDAARTGSMLHWLAAEARKGGIGKILLEPHLRRRFALPPEVVRFQGCSAARHDDHVHLAVR